MHFFQSRAIGYLIHFGADIIFSVYRFGDNHGIKFRLLSKQKSAGFLEMASK